MTAISYQLLFAVLVCMPIALLPLPKVRVQAGGSDRATFIIWAGLALSFIAFICLLIDRAQQGIDYSQGVCYARGQMTRLGHLRAGVRSPFSFIGNLFGPSFFVSVALLLTQQMSRRKFWVAMCVAFAMLMCLSVISASRSGILLFAGFALACVCVRTASGQTIPRLRTVDCVMIIVMAFFATGFVLSIFNCRAVASNMSATEYKQTFETYLGARSDSPPVPSLPRGPLLDDRSPEASPHGTEVPRPAPEVSPRAKAPEVVVPAPQLQGAPQTPEASTNMRGAAADHSGFASGTRAAFVADKASGLLGVTALYATHSLLTFAYTLSEPDRYGRVLFTYPMLILSKIGLVEPPSLDWLLAGRFASLPGGLWYDFGLAGLIAGGLILGLAIWGGVYLVRLQHSNELFVGFTSLSVLIAFLSPIHSAIEFTNFPFVCFAFVFLYTVMKLFFPRRTNN